MSLKQGRPPEAGKLFRPWNALFIVEKMHLRETAAWCEPGSWPFVPKPPFLVSKTSF
jgi:hypothetical protein